LKSSFTPEDVLFGLKHCGPAHSGNVLLKGGRKALFVVESQGHVFPSFRDPLTGSWQHHCPEAGCTGKWFPRIAIGASNGVTDVWAISGGTAYHVDPAKAGFKSPPADDFSLIPVPGQNVDQVAVGGPGRAWATTSSGQNFYMTTNWLQFGGDATHSGFNSFDTTISVSNISGLHALTTFTPPLSQMVGIQSSPVVVTAVSIPGVGSRDVAYYTTAMGQIWALDAHTGTEYWHATPPAPPALTVWPMASTPAVNSSLNHVYMAGGDGKVHRFALGAVGVPAEVALPGGSAGVYSLNLDKENAVTSLTISPDLPSNPGYLYVGSGGNRGCESGQGTACQGHVTTLDIGSGGIKVFNAICSNINGHPTSCASNGAGIWSRYGGVTFDPVTSAVYAVSGNGTYDAAAYKYGNAILKLSRSGGGGAGWPTNGVPVGSFSANSGGYDLGSTSLLVLPTNNGTGQPNVGFHVGRDKKLRLINLQTMALLIDPAADLGTSNAPLRTPAMWVNPADGKIYFYVNVGYADKLKAFRLDTTPTLKLTDLGWTLETTTDIGGSPTIANGILYYSNGNKLLALNALTGAKLWEAPISSSAGQAARETPVLVNGTLYFGVAAYGL
jgi:hypothetical protein